MWELVVDLCRKKMGIISQYVSIIASNQKHLQRPQIPNFDVIDAMRYCFVDIATQLYSCWCCREV